MTKRGRINLGLASVLFAFVGASSLGACSSDDTTTNTAGSGGTAGTAGKAGAGGTAGKAGGGSSGKGGGGAGGSTAGSTAGGAAGAIEAGAAGSGEGGMGGMAEGGMGGEGGMAPVCMATPLVKPTGVPANIALKDTAVLVAAYDAVGSQIYTCTPTTVGTTTTYAWSTASVPSAMLYDQTCMLAGTHYAGPHWASTDGSIILGTKLRAADSTTAASVPLLLLTTAVDGGVAGKFTPVTAVQRLKTVGGIAPTTACGVANSGGTAAIPYTATYYFYSGTDIIPAAP